MPPRRRGVLLGTGHAAVATAAAAAAGGRGNGDVDGDAVSGGGGAAGCGRRVAAKGGRAGAAGGGRRAAGVTLPVARRGRPPSPPLAATAACAWTGGFPPGGVRTRTRRRPQRRRSRLPVLDGSDGYAACHAGRRYRRLDGGAGVWGRPPRRPLPPAPRQAVPRAALSGPLRGYVVGCAPRAPRRRYPRPLPARSGASRPCLSCATSALAWGWVAGAPTERRCVPRRPPRRVTAGPAAVLLRRTWWSCPFFFLSLLYEWMTRTPAGEGGMVRRNRNACDDRTRKRDERGGCVRGSAVRALRTPPRWEGG